MTHFPVCWIIMWITKETMIRAKKKKNWKKIDSIFSWIGQISGWWFDSFFSRNGDHNIDDNDVWWWWWRWSLSFKIIEIFDIQFVLSTKQNGDYPSTWPLRLHIKEKIGCWTKKFCSKKWFLCLLSLFFFGLNPI